MISLFTFDSSFLTGLIQSLGWVLFHSLWQLSLLGFVAAILLQCLRNRSSTIRYRCLVLIMVGAVIAPVATWSIQDPFATSLGPEIAPEKLDRLSSGKMDGRLVANSEVIANKTNSTKPAMPNPTTLHDPQSAGVSDNNTVGSNQGSVIQQNIERTIEPWLVWIVAIWFVGFVICSLRPIAGWAMLRRLRTRGISRPGEQVRDALRRVSRRIGISDQVQIFKSSMASTPLVIGYFRPMILLPASLVTNIPMSQLEAILAHELAHIKRHDFLINLTQVIVETLFFYHPVIWWLSRRIRIEREHCCDDMVVQRLDNRTEYGRALIAIGQMQRNLSPVALGAGDGSLVARIGRIAGQEANIETGRVSSMLPLGLGLCSIVIAVFCGLLNPPALAAAEADEFGPESNGIRCRVIAVASGTDDDSPDLKKAADQYKYSADMTFAVELKNVGVKPISLVGMKNPTLAAQLFEFQFFDTEGSPVPRPKRKYFDDAVLVHSAIAHELDPGQSKIFVLRPGKFMAPMDFDLEPGEYRVKVRYKGPSSPNKTIREHMPDHPTIKAWKHQVESKTVSFSIKKRSQRATADELQWGDATKGLQAAVEFRAVGAAEGNPMKAPGVKPGTKIESIFHVRNVSKKAITFVSETHRQGDTLTVSDENGIGFPVENTWYSGWPIDVAWTLQPGEIAQLNVLSPTFSTINTSGKLNFNFDIRFNSRVQKDAEGNVVFPRPEDYNAVLKTGTGTLWIDDGSEENDFKLADAVKQFNLENEKLDRGQDQPALTEKEVVDAIRGARWSDLTDDLNEKEIESLKSIARSGELPEGSYLRAYSSQQTEAFLIKHFWHIQLFIPAIDHDGFVRLTIRNEQFPDEKIDPDHIAWGAPDVDGLELGGYMSPKKDSYVMGEKVRLLLYVRNNGRESVSSVWSRTTHPMPDDFSVVDNSGKPVSVKIGHDDWNGGWVSGAMGGDLAPGDTHFFNVPYEIRIGGLNTMGTNKRVGRILDVQEGKKYEFKVRASNGSQRKRKRGEPKSETGLIQFDVSQSKD